MTTTNPRTSLLRALVVMLVPAALLAGCGTDTEPAATPAPTTSTPTPSPTPTSTGGLSAADEAAILSLFEKYQDATHRAYTTPDDDPTAWSGISNEELIAADVAGVKNYIDQGITFTGAQVYNDVTVTADGPDAAIIHACLDESGWIGTQDGKALPPRPTDVYPVTFAASRLTGTWLLGIGPEVPAGSTC